MPALALRSCLRRLSVRCRITARFWSAWPVLTRLWSSSKATSNTQCRLFSMLQWLRAPSHHLTGDVLLAAHGVIGQRSHRYQAPFQFQHLQQFRYRRDLIGVSLGAGLPQHHPVLRGPGAYPVQRTSPVGSVMTTPQGLAIYRHHLAMGQFTHRTYPVHTYPVHEAG